MAKTLCDLRPDDVNALIHRSFALHELKRTTEAEALLLPALDLFPDEPTIAYNRACYACVLGRVKEARKLLGRAIIVSGDHGDEVKLMALEDPDLAGLRDSSPEKNKSTG